MKEDPLEDSTVQDLRAQLAELQRAYKKRDDEAKRLAEFVIALRKRPPGAHPELLLLTVAVLCGARLAWFAEVEEWGTRAKVEGGNVTNGFLMIAGILLVIWLVHEARVNGWTVIAESAALAVGLRIGLDEWMKGHAVTGTVIAIGTLVALALPFLGRALQTAAQFATDPLLLLRK
jgi:hypothetical protein